MQSKYWMPTGILICIVFIVKELAFVSDMTHITKLLRGFAINRKIHHCKNGDIGSAFTFV